MNPVGGKISRASRRLEIARRLMRMEEGADVLGRIKSFPPEKRDHLRDLVDWIEEYENYEL